MQKFIVFSGIGLQLGALIFVALMVGRYLDQWFHSNGLIFIGLTLIFLILWFIQILWLIKKIEKTQTQAPKSESEHS